MEFLKKYWKWMLVGAAILALILFINSKTGTSGKLWDYAMDQLVDRQKEVVKTLEDELKKVEAERDRYYKDLAQVKKERVVLKNEITELEVKNRELKEKLSNINIPTTAPELVERLKGRGFHPRIP